LTSTLTRLKLGVAIKRLAFWAVLFILIFTVLACDAFSPPDGVIEDDPNDVTYTDVVYSPDGKSVTIYLDGGVPVQNRQMRALSKELAVAGHDFFEVAFYYQAGPTRSSSDVIARTSWELMTDAKIRGVRGKGAGEAGVDYAKNAVYREVPGTEYKIIGYRDPVPPEEGPQPVWGYVPVINVENNLSQGEGAAILFVGRKTDKTLLGVGKLTSTDTGGTTIIPATKTVTFTVAAIESGLSSVSSENCFWTNSDGPSVGADFTGRSVTQMNGLDFYTYRLRDQNTDGTNITSGEYTFRTYGSDFNADYRLGIILADGAAYETKQPRYPTADGRFQYFSVMLDDKTVISPINNTADDIGKPFMNPVDISFNTTYTVPGSVFALAFQVPVCPLYLDDEAGMWYIRPSYDSYWLDLDDAGLSRPSKGAGGAIMFKTGSIADISAYRIRVVAPPYKYLYSYHTFGSDNAGTPSIPSDMNPVNRYFNVNGLLVALEYFNGDFIRYLNNEELTFEIGMKSIKPRVNYTSPAAAGDPLPMTVYGFQTVKVIYFHPASMVNHETSFHIIVDNSQRQYTGIPDNGIPPNSARPPDVNDNSYTPSNTDYFPGSGIPMRNFIVIDNINNLITNNQLADYLNTRMGYSGKTVSTFVLIFARTQQAGFSFDFSAGMDLQSLNNYPNLIICVAARTTGSGTYYPAEENTVHVGRGSGTLTYGVYRAWGTSNAFYFGKWPFNDYLYGVRHGIPPPPGTDYHDLGAVGRYDYVQTINLTSPSAVRVFHKTYNYSFDAYGPVAANGTPSPSGANPVAGSTGTYDRYFLNDGHGGRFYNVTVDPEITFYNRRWLN